MLTIWSDAAVSSRSPGMPPGIQAERESSTSADRLVQEPTLLTNTAVSCMTRYDHRVTPSGPAEWPDAASRSRSEAPAISWAASERSWLPGHARPCQRAIAKHAAGSRSKGTRHPQARLHEIPASPVCVARKTTVRRSAHRGLPSRLSLNNLLPVRGRARRCLRYRRHSCTSAAPARWVGTHPKPVACVS